MRKRVNAILVVITVIGAVITAFFALPRTAMSAAGDVISSFQIGPIDDRDRVSQGLDYDGTNLIYLDAFYDDPSGTSRDYFPTVYRLSITPPNVGSIVSSFQAPESTPEFHKGLAWDGQYIWISKANGIEHSWVRRVSTPEVNYPITSNGHPYDITYYGGYIYEIDGVSGVVYKINAGDGSVAGSFNGPTTKEEKYFGLTNDGANIYIGTYGRSSRIYKLTFSGSLVSSFAAPCGYPMGLAYDGQYLWCVDDRTETFYQFEK